MIWILGLAVLGGSFLPGYYDAEPEGLPDARRDVSEVDIPIADDIAAYEEDIEPGLAAFVEEAGEEWFGMDSDKLAESGLIDVHRLEAGKLAYAQYCTGCHGSTGDGAGPAARYLETRPRILRKGVYKFTSTGTGIPPLRVDIYNTITRGLAGSSMPEFRLLSEERRWDITEYVRYLSLRGAFEHLLVDIAWDEEELPDAEEVADIIHSRWSPEKVRATYPPISEPKVTDATIARGRELFIDVSGANCASCHGEGGKGDGPSANEFSDAWGYPIVPRDLTTGQYRAGATPADLYRSISTGIGGTPMPAYGDSMSPEDIWSLVHFIQSLARS